MKTGNGKKSECTTRKRRTLEEKENSLRISYVEKKERRFVYTRIVLSLSFNRATTYYLQPPNL